MAGELSNARIDQLPPNPGLKPGFFGVVRNMETNVTERFDFAQILTSTISGNFEWLTDTEYDNLEAVTWKGQWFQAVQDVPENIIPGTDPAYWVLINQSASGFVFWAPGVYPYDQVFVLKDVSIAQDNSDIRMYYLVDTTRPYISSDFDDELADGDWVQLFSSSVVPDPEVLRMKADWTDATKYPDPADLLYAIKKNFVYRVSTGAGITLNGEFWPDGTWLVARIDTPAQLDANWDRRA